MLEKILKKHYSYYDLSRQDHYERSVYPTGINMFLLYFNYNDCRPSASSIDFKELCWGETKSNVIKHLGKPRYTFSNVIGENTFSIIFYKEKILKDSFLSQLHFINDRFFFGCYTYKEWNPKKREGFKNIITDKYISENVDVSLNPIKIADKENNRIIIVDSVNLHIGYLGGDRKVHDIIKISDDLQKEAAAVNSSNKIIKLYSSF